MQAVKTIGLDIAKSGFQVHGVNADGTQAERVRRAAALASTPGGEASTS